MDIFFVHFFRINNLGDPGECWERSPGGVRVEYGIYFLAGFVNLVIRSPQVSEGFGDAAFGCAPGDVHAQGDLPVGGFSVIRGRMALLCRLDHEEACDGRLSRTVL
jgi:hypothetical protein